MDSLTSFVSSVNAIDGFYPDVTGESEVLNRSIQPQHRITQTEFLHLLLKLHVPILGKGRNREVQDMLSIGHGASYSVTQALSLISRTNSGLLNKNPPKLSGVSKLQEPRAFVTKRIVPLPLQASDDARQLAAITNEIRILANEAVCNAPCLVDLLGVAWDEVPTAGRHWPRLLIEAATHGTLGQFVATHADSEDLGVRMALLYDVLEGLDSLHTGGIAHCDVKAENILIFAPDEDITANRRYHAKLCDFGFAIIQADYEDGATIRSRLGTEPWNAPELMGSSSATIAKLPMADLYSFGLLFVLVLLRGNSPFGHMSLVDIAEMKGRLDGDDQGLTVLETSYLAIDGLDSLNDPQRATCAAMLQSALAHYPEDRGDISELIASSLSLLSSESSFQPWIYDQPVHRVKDNEMLNLESIPELELASEFCTFELPDSVANELMRDLLNIANGPTSNTDISEAVYQLAVASYEGIGTTRDQKKCIEWLEKAVILGSSKALVAACNISTSFAKSQDSANITEKIRAEAETDLLGAFYEMAGNNHYAHESFPSLRYWAAQEIEAYHNYRRSPVEREREAVLFQAALSLTERQMEYPPFDFLPTLEGLDLSGDPHFDVSKKDSFVKSVRRAGCVDSITHARLTLLQFAALFGELELAQALVVDLKADIEAVGDTPGFTPLWISCFLGYFDIAWFLISHGADPTVRDTEFQRTVLHLLNRFTNRDEISLILDIGLQVGLDVDEPDSAGNTPLLSTFMGWDLSDGAAAQLLLESNANPLARASSGFDAIYAAIRSMDTELLELLLSHAAKYGLKTGSSGEILFSPLQKAKAKAFVELIHRSEFYYRRICGPGVAEKLASVIDAILENETMEILQSMGVSTFDGSPLQPACYRKRNDILTAILHSRPKYSLNDIESDGMNALLWCGERGNTDGVIKLLQAGADPLVCNARGYNVFHTTARFAPTCLDQVLIAVDRGEVFGSSGLNSMAMVTTRSQNEERMTPFLLALMEGTPEHLKCVENLKRRYDLDYDAYIIPPINVFGQDNSKAFLTPTAYLTLAAVLSNTVTMEQVHYLLQLNPRPKFKADTSGSTLLHFAVCGFYNANMNSNSTGYAVLRLLLQTFPGQVHVEAANDAGNTPIHLAAAAANITALEIIQSHLSSRGETFNVNMRNKRGRTALDMVGDHQLVKHLKNDYMQKTFRERSESTRSFLRRFHGEEGVGIEEGLRNLHV